MKAEELGSLSLEDLVVRARDLRAEHFNVKVKHATGQLENTAKLRTLRRDIARLETVLREKRGATR